MSSATDLTKFKGKHVSDLPPGASGYELKSAEETLNEFADSGLTITSSKDWVETLPQTFAFPEHSNPLDFLKVKDQQQVGACAGFGMAQAGEGCFWVASGGKVRRISGWAQYILAQEKGDMRQRNGGFDRRQDIGSHPKDVAWAAMNIGLVPEQMCPPSPTTYDQGWEVTDAMREAAGENKIKSIVHFTKPAHLFKYLQTGQGYITMACKWMAHFDQGPKKDPVNSFFGPQRQDRHGGGHQVSIMGFTNHAQHGLCALIVNSWNTVWRDDGAALFTMKAIEEAMSDQMSIFLGYSDMSVKEKKQRKIDIVHSDWV